MKAKRIYVSNIGEFKVGDEETVFTKKFKLILFGQQLDEQTVLTPFIEPTNKSIVNNGLFVINSTSVQTQFAKLAQNAIINDSTITLSKNTDWQIGDEIAISSTS